MTNATPIPNESCAPCGCDWQASHASNAKGRTVAVEFLYLDLDTCERCIATDAIVDQAVDQLQGVFDCLGHTVTIDKVNITSRELAEKYRFVSSPTIRVNGMDICTQVQENLCVECGEICGGQTTCRVFVYEGTEYEQPPKAMIVDGILRALYAPEESNAHYALPENLKRFFDGLACQGCGECENEQPKLEGR